MPKEVVTKTKAYMLVHIDDDGNAMIREEDGFYDTVGGWCNDGDAVLYYDHNEAEKSAERHNDPDDINCPCVLVEVEVSVRAKVSP